MTTDRSLSDRVQDVIGDALSIQAPTPDTDLIDAGLLDSLGLVTLLAELEHWFSIEIPLDDLDVDRFRSVATIADFVAERERAAGSEVS